MPGCCFRRAFFAATRRFALLRAFWAGLRLLALAVVLGMTLHHYVCSLAATRYLPAGAGGAAAGAGVPAAGAAGVALGVGAPGAAGSPLGAPLVAGAAGGAVGAEVCGVAFGSSLFCPHPTTKIAVNMIRAVQTLVAFMGSSILPG